MVIQRDFAKQRKDGVSNDRTALLDDFDYLMWISDFSRIGAIRLRDSEGIFQRRADHKRQIPPLIELPQLLRASKAIEENQETLNDLEYLRGVGTSLGGLRPNAASSMPMEIYQLGNFQAWEIPDRSFMVRFWPFTWESAVVSMLLAHRSLTPTVFQLH